MGLIACHYRAVEWRYKEIASSQHTSSCSTSTERAPHDAAAPRAAAPRAAAYRTYGNGSSEMRVLLSTYGSRGDIEAMVGLAVQLRALGAEGCEALVATGVMPAGVWL
jgi:hypothetical protein